ncbi:hypothetical protein GW17_00059480 [Ensete ventricosum]|nr:hypothetical protein GW17_00059480 [Ensete ventricosum]
MQGVGRVLPRISEWVSIEKLRRVLPNLRAIKDMTKVWLVEEVVGVQCRPLVMKDLYDMGGRAGEDRYFTARILDLSVPKAGTLMEAQWVDLLAPTQFWSEELVAAAYARGALHPIIVK